MDDVVDFTIGSAFAVSSSRLATNAHVVLGVIQNPFPVDRVVAVQSGTGLTIDLIRAYVHPNYDGDPLRSPDVGVFEVGERVDDYLTLSPVENSRSLAPGDPLALTGFPGDVQELFEITPGLTVPQATSLSGSVTALRSFDPTSVVGAETVD
ncbi:MAG: trypsin-like serine protease, partial [Planctomycetota bacterium]